jgi:hypothetical protein
MVLLSFWIKKMGRSKAKDGSWRIENLKNEKLFVEIIRDNLAKKGSKLK